MKTIDKNDVKHIALLSRLSLSEDELEIHSKQLASIVSYINKLNEIDTSTVLPTSHVLASLKNVFRKDVLKVSLPADKALANAPARDGDFFKVPQVIEGK